MKTGTTQRPADMHIEVRPLLRRVHSTDTEAFLEARFRAEILPLLTPVVIDRAHPFPFFGAGIRGLVVRFRATTSRRYGVVLVHPALGQFVETPSGERIPLEHVIGSHLAELFGRLSVDGCWAFGVALGESSVERAANDVAEFLVTALRKSPRCRRALGRTGPAAGIGARSEGTTAWLSQ